MSDTLTSLFFTFSSLLISVQLNLRRKPRVVGAISGYIAEDGSSGSSSAVLISLLLHKMRVLITDLLSSQASAKLQQDG